MRLPAGFERHGKSWRLRLRVPADVRDKVGQSYLVEKITEPDQDRALAIFHGRVAAAQLTWNGLRGKLAPEVVARLVADAKASRLADERVWALRPEDPPSVAPLREAMGDDGLRDYLDGLDPKDALSGVGLDVLTASGGPDLNARRREALKTGLGKDGPALVRGEVRAAMVREGFPATRTALRQARAAILQGWHQALNTPLDALPERAKPDSAAEPSATIAAQLEVFVGINPRGVSADTMASNAACVRHFATSMPSGFRATDIKRRHVHDWADILRATPVKAADARLFRGMTPSEVVAANETIGRPTLSRKSVNRYLGGLGAFCSWLTDRGVLDDNPVRGSFSRIDRTKRPVRAFTPDELQRLFSTPLFSGHQMDAEHRPGPVRAWGWPTWLFILGRVTGCRLRELCQLRTDDVRNDGEFWTLSVSDEGPGQSIKNALSRRLVPLHVEAVRLGFVGYVELRRAAGDPRLFPEIGPDTRGQISGVPSKRLNTYLLRVGIKADRSTNFHSLRHSFADECRRAGMMDAEFAFLMGHSSVSTAQTRAYGSTREGLSQHRRELVSRLAFLDLAQLAPG